METQSTNNTPSPNNIPIRRAVTTKKKQGKEVIVSKSKMDLFLEEYVKSNGNGTEAALKVFNCKDRLMAAQIAHVYLKRAQLKGRVLLEAKGYAYGDLIDVAIQKMTASKTPEWWDRLMKMGDYDDFITKQGVTKTTVAVMEVQKGLIDEYVEGEYVEDEA